MFAELDGLGAAFCAEFVEGAAAVGFDGVFADEESGGDFAVGEAFGDQGEDFKFAAGNAELVAVWVVCEEGCWRGEDGDFFEDGFLPGAGEFETQTDAEGGEEGGDQGDVDLGRVIEDEELVLGPFEDGDEETAEEAEGEDLAFHGFALAIMVPHGPLGFEVLVRAGLDDP